MHKIIVAGSIDQLILSSNGKDLFEVNHLNTIEQLLHAWSFSQNVSPVTELTQVNFLNFFVFSEVCVVVHHLITLWIELNLDVLTFVFTNGV